MAHIKLSTTLRTLEHRLYQAEQLAIDADAWSAKASDFPSDVPEFTLDRRDAIIEMAFFQAFLAWEAFLEESFILYLLGKSPPKGRSPSCYYGAPSTRKLTQKLLIPEGRKFARWSNVGEVKTRAKRFFRGGRPYVAPLTAYETKLIEIVRIRNAIAHTSEHSQESYEELVRDELAVLPSRPTVGEFLRTIVPNSATLESFLEHYLGYFRLVAAKIVPT